MAYYSNLYLRNITQNGDLVTHNSRYKKKYNNLKKRIKNLVIENAALCDEVAQVQEDIVVVKEERRFLLRKLLEYEGDVDTYQGTRNSTSPSTSFSEHVAPVKKGKKRSSSDGQERKQTKGRRSNKALGKRLVQLIPLDPSGRPIFPICFGNLTVHSLGEVISDKPMYHTTDLIFPVGFVSTRVYGSLRDPSKKCMYTCKISDGGNVPQFEIAADTDLDSPIIGSSPDYCHGLLLQQINSIADIRSFSTLPKGAKFFGLSHPTILNLIQSSLGARKCTNYKWTRFEVSKTGEVPSGDENDPTISFDALQRRIMLSAYHTMPEIKEEPPDDILDSESH